MRVSHPTPRAAFLDRTGSACSDGRQSVSLPAAALDPKTGPKDVPYTQKRMSLELAAAAAVITRPPPTTKTGQCPGESDPVLRTQAVSATEDVPE